MHRLLLTLSLLTVAPLAQAVEPPAGLKIASAGHSFHYFLPPLIAEIAKGANIKDHTQLTLSAIGGSRMIQHWDVVDIKNKLKPLLNDGKVDLMTMATLGHPEPGIDKFVKLGLEKNPKMRFTIQCNWLPYDQYVPELLPKKPMKVDRNARTVEELKKDHAPYAMMVDDHAIALNKEYSKDVVFVVPVGQSVILLREKVVEGKAPGIEKQVELFTDELCHAGKAIQYLNAYCHYAVIYKTSPVGLPSPAGLKTDKDAEKLNTLLQELAWEAVTAHPLSGVKK